MENKPHPLHTHQTNIESNMPTEESPTSSSQSNTRLTPDSDSEGSESDLELGDGKAESYRLQAQRKEAGEKANGPDEDDSEEEDGGYARRRKASISTVQSYQLYTPDEERAVVKKFDRKLVLFVALLYMLSFLDRSSAYTLHLEAKEYELILLYRYR